MPRPRKNSEQRFRAYQLFGLEFGPSAIHKAVVEQFKDGDEPASLRTINTWVREFKQAEDEITKKDKPFELHRLEEYGLSWSESGFLLNMWMYANRGDLYRFDVPGYYEIPAPTVRQVQWWSRVRQAVPELENLVDIWYISQRFATREMRHELFGDPLQLDDLEAWLAYGCCISDKWLANYQDDVARGLIPGLLDDHDEADMVDVLFGSELAKSTLDPIPLTIESLQETGDCPYLPPSKQKFVTIEHSIYRTESTSAEGLGNDDADGPAR